MNPTKTVIIEERRRIADELFVRTGDSLVLTASYDKALAQYGQEIADMILLHRRLGIALEQPLSESLQQIIKHANDGLYDAMYRASID